MSLIEEAEKYVGLNRDWIVNSPISVRFFGGYKIVLRKKNKEELDRDIERQELQKKADEFLCRLSHRGQLLNKIQRNKI